MLFNEIHPFIRFARYLVQKQGNVYTPTVPYDARLFYTLDGKGSIRVGKTTYEMLPGCLILLNPGVEYHFLSSNEGVTYIAFNFDFTYNSANKKTPIPPSPKKTFDNCKIIPSPNFSDADCLNHVLFLKNIFEAEKNLKHIETEYSRKIIYCDAQMSGTMTQVLTCCVRKFNLKNFPSETANEKTIEILTYIHDNYNKNLTNAELGRIFAYHPNYINYLIKTCTGVSLHHYIMKTRISNAITLLDQGATSITEISNICGFSDIYYFSRYFKKATGSSPSAYKKGDF